MSAIDRHVGARLRSLRVARGLSQAELGLHLDLLPEGIAAFEVGALRPSANQIVRLASVLKTSTWALFEGAVVAAKPVPSGHTVVSDAIDALFSCESLGRQDCFDETLKVLAHVEESQPPA